MADERRKGVSGRVALGEFLDGKLVVVLAVLAVLVVRGYTKTIVMQVSAVLHHILDLIKGFQGSEASRGSRGSQGFSGCF